ncbi:MAG: flagellar protein FlaG [Gammaproteobacteria bacterium]|nr:flagellar protein FlaG [Gammaproteobacteria bacterium]
MPIETITQAGGAPPRPAAPKPVTPVNTESSSARQELPGSGKAVPESSGASDVRQAVSRINDYVQAFRRDLQFQVDKDTNHVVVRVVDSESGEVIRQMPSEEVLAVAHNLEKAQGLLFNEKA